MPLFTVLCRVDAYVDYKTVVLADDAEEASWLAQENASEYEWEEHGAVEFDARGYVTLNVDGVEIDETRRGDF
jgi:hypothetical protein